MRRAARGGRVQSVHLAFSGSRSSEGEEEARGLPGEKPPQTQAALIWGKTPRLLPGEGSIVALHGHGCPSSPPHSRSQSGSCTGLRPFCGTGTAVDLEGPWNTATSSTLTRTPAFPAPPKPCQSQFPPETRVLPVLPWAGSGAAETLITTIVQMGKLRHGKLSSLPAAT